MSKKEDENSEAHFEPDNNGEESAVPSTSGTSEKKGDSSKEEKLKYKDEAVELEVSFEGGSDIVGISSNKVESAEKPLRVLIMSQENLKEEVFDVENPSWGTKSGSLNHEGKHALYSKYADLRLSIPRENRRSFLIPSSSETKISPSVGSYDYIKEAVIQSADFTHGYRENKRYIIHKLTEHETHRLGSNKLLEEATKIAHEVDFRDHVTLGLSYLTVSSKRYLKLAFLYLSHDIKPIGKVYTARMLGRYHEFGKLFNYIAGREAGMVGSMRFTSHCSDIIKSYIQLAQLLHNSKEFSDIILDLSKRHAKLGLKLKDHQAHYLPFTEIMGSLNVEPFTVYCNLLFFVSLVSRAMIRAETSISQDEFTCLNREADSRKPTKQTLKLVATSSKQPIWD